jgi:hypothetical protein
MERMTTIGGLLGEGELAEVDYNGEKISEEDFGSIT